MIRTKGEAGTGNVVEAVRHMRRCRADIRKIQNMSEDELYGAARSSSAPNELVQEVHDRRLSVVIFRASGIATPADAALMMQLGSEGDFVGSGIFKSQQPGEDGQGHRQGDDALPRRQHHRRGLPRHGTAMQGLEIGAIPENEILSKRGW